MPSSLATFHQPSALGPLLDALATLLTWQFSLFLANLAKAHNWFTSTFLFYIFFLSSHCSPSHTASDDAFYTRCSLWCCSLLALFLSLARSFFVSFPPVRTNEHTHPSVRTHTAYGIPQGESERREKNSSRFFPNERLAFQGLLQRDTYSSYASVMIWYLKYTNIRRQQHCFHHFCICTWAKTKIFVWETISGKVFSFSSGCWLLLLLLLLKPEPVLAAYCWYWLRLLSHALASSLCWYPLHSSHALATHTI